MAGGGHPYNIIVYHKNGSNTYKMYCEFDYSPYGITYGELLDCVKNNKSYSTSTILNIVGTGTASGDEIGLSTSDGGTAIDLTSYIPAASQVTTLPDLILYALYSEPETITGFYLDGTKYEFNGGGTAEGIITTQPSNPIAGSTYYDTTNNVIKVYNGTSWEEVGGGNVIAMTQSEYDALPAATKNDGKLRIITDAPTLDIVDDTAFGASWDGDTDTAPSKNAVYDAIGNIETLLAAI